MVSLPIRLGYKYFRSKKGALISLTSGIAIAALAIAVSVLIIVSSVMNGLEKELQDRILGVVPHVLIHSNEPIDNFTSLVNQLEDNPHQQPTHVPHIPISQKPDHQNHQLQQFYHEAEYPIH